MPFFGSPLCNQNWGIRLGTAVVLVGGGGATINCRNILERVNRSTCVFRNPPTRMTYQSSRVPTNPLFLYSSIVPTKNGAHLRFTRCTYYLRCWSRLLASLSSPFLTSTSTTSPTSPTISNFVITDSTRFPMSQQTTQTRLPGQAESSSAAAKTGESLDYETVGSRGKAFWLIELLIRGSRL